MQWVYNSLQQQATSYIYFAHLVDISLTWDQSGLNKHEMQGLSNSKDQVCTGHFDNNVCILVTHVLVIWSNGLNWAKGCKEYRMEWEVSS